MRPVDRRPDSPRRDVGRTSLDLTRDRVEQGCRLNSARDERRHSPQRRLLLHEQRAVGLCLLVPGDVAAHADSQFYTGISFGARCRQRRVVVAEDDVLLREGIVSLLTGAGFDVVGQVGDASTLASVVREQVPDLVITDIRMPPTQQSEGLDAARQIRAEFPQIGILVLSAHVEVDKALDLLEDGRGIGYLLKSRVMKAHDVVDALQRIADGGSVVDPALVQELVAQRHRDDPLEELTPREREVLALMAEGHSNLGIAARIVVTEGAVEKHVRSILGKLRLPVTEDSHRRVLAVLIFLAANR